jgi:hypothetical protein
MYVNVWASTHFDRHLHGYETRATDPIAAFRYTFALQSGRVE